VLFPAGKEQSMTSYPPDIERFVQTQLTSGKFPSRAEFEIAAARCFMACEEARERVRADVQAALDEVALGLEEEWDPEEDKRYLIERLDEHGRPR
jgi:hypothetical protein